MSIFDGLTYTEKTIEVKARLTVQTMEAFFVKKDELNRYVLGDDGFYITKMYPDVGFIRVRVGRTNNGQN